MMGVQGGTARDLKGTSFQMMGVQGGTGRHGAIQIMGVQDGTGRHGAGRHRRQGKITGVQD